MPEKTTKPLYKNPWAIALLIFIGFKIVTSLFINETLTLTTIDAGIQADCIPNWQCTSWSKCGELERQTRTCSDNSSCKIDYDKPSITQTCTHVAIEPDPILISGHGQGTSQYFELEEGISIFQMSTNKNGYFSIALYDENGDYIKLLANKIGSFEGSEFVSIDESGKYFLDVAASGDWKVSIE